MRLDAAIDLVFEPGRHSAGFDVLRSQHLLLVLARALRISVGGHNPGLTKQWKCEEGDCLCRENIAHTSYRAAVFLMTSSPLRPGTSPDCLSGSASARRSRRGRCRR